MRQRLKKAVNTRDMRQQVGKDSATGREDPRILVPENLGHVLGYQNGRMRQRPTYWSWEYQTELGQKKKVVADTRTWSKDKAGPRSAQG